MAFRRSRARSLSIPRPNNNGSDNGYSLIERGTEEETAVAKLVARVAGAGRLVGLRRFGWEGMESPEDEMWVTLRVSCVSYLVRAVC